MNRNGNKIDQLLRELKVSRIEFADSLGVTTNAIANWKKRELGINVINKIVNVYPQVSREWLITGEGPIFKTNTDTMYQSVFEAAPSEIKDSKESSERQDSSGMMDMMEMYAQRIRLVDDLRITLKEELQQVQSIKEELRAQRDETARLQQSLHDAIFALRNITRGSSNNIGMVAESRD